MTVMTGAAIKAGRGLKRDFGEVAAEVSMREARAFWSNDQLRGEDPLSRTRKGAAGLRLRLGGRTRRGTTDRVTPASIRSMRRPASCAIPLFASQSRWSAEAIIAGVIYNPSQR